MSVPTDRQTISMHRYLQSKCFRCSVGTPLMCHVLVVNSYVIPPPLPAPPPLTEIMYPPLLESHVTMCWSSDQS